MCVYSVVSNCLQPDGWVAHQTPLSMGFSRQEDWGRLPFPSSRDLPGPGIEPTSPSSPVLADRFFTTTPVYPYFTSEETELRELESFAQRSH